MPAAKFKAPSFLSEVTIKKDDIPRLEELASNWMKLHSEINTLDEKTLGKLMLFELKGICRPHIIARVKQRFNKLRNHREDREIMRANPG